MPSARYNPRTRGHGKPYQSEQVRRMEAVSKSHHPGRNHGMKRLDTLLEEKTESATERRMEIQAKME